MINSYNNYSIPLVPTLPEGTLSFVILDAAPKITMINNYLQYSIPLVLPLPVEGTLPFVILDAVPKIIMINSYNIPYLLFQLYQ